MKNIFSFLPPLKSFSHFYILLSYIILISSYINSKPLYSQKVLLSQNVEKDSIIPSWGPNRKHFIGLYIGISGVAGKSGSGASVLYDHSSEFTVGLNYKRRLSNHEAIGCKISYDLGSYRLKPNTKFDNTNSVLHKKEKLAFNSFSLSLYNRINFDKRRGNFLGHYLDLGVYGSWLFSVRHYTKDDINGTIIKTYTSHLPYTENTGYGAFLNLGFNRFTIYSKYRISDYFKDSYELPELPRYIVGITYQITD
jgi:hypothetical protein